ncbi:hypothetical protein ANCCAN_12429 [Ancylostoma caninum]|uniref:Uncharacterized protein n=1 Tax=Ancylostoma caninum TaxID=29170 RepID=A0A368GEX9_ANCCA|nr:hypothetical protein ANCCAN_12429 [Ancylostoma caninum]
MLKIVVLLVALVLSVNAGVFDCDARGKCRPGMMCVDGTCVHFTIYFLIPIQFFGTIRPPLLRKFRKKFP